jgi:molecular chaperone DnaJ
MGSICYYDVLGVGRSVTADELKAAYQQQALQLHPDRAGECSQDRFQLLQQAWQVSRARHHRTAAQLQLHGAKSANAA